MTRKKQQFGFEVTGNWGGDQLRHGDRREKLIKNVLGASSIRGCISLPLPIIQFIALEPFPKLREYERSGWGRFLLGWSDLWDVGNRMPQLVDQGRVTAQYGPLDEPPGHRIRIRCDADLARGRCYKRTLQLIGHAAG